MTLQYVNYSYFYTYTTLSINRYDRSFEFSGVVLFCRTETAYQVIVIRMYRKSKQCHEKRCCLPGIILLCSLSP